MYHNLYIQRRERRLSQKNLAKLLRISQSSYQNKEIGRTAFTLPEAVALAEYFSTT
ncbi:helix-turn-helix transcriptional regulator [Planococcus beigongshangi]|uniref:helix-turn-helix transcriptional regulator n=1 Tax=Planococcus beigongshangi TaxID=2782536 RepID=UPI00193AF198|nr:helix-turn-helix transcriptional regulator [Planococcus beigongshangi]